MATALVAALAGPATASARTQTVTFTDPGEQAFVVPSGIDTIHVEAVGERGVATGGVSGGIGALVTGNLSVEPGQVLYVNVAVGGGAGGLGAHAGGGGSDLRLCSASAAHCDNFADSLHSRLLVAGGGGGASIGAGGNAGEDGPATCATCIESGHGGGLASGGRGGRAHPRFPSSGAGEGGQFGVGGRGGDAEGAGGGPGGGGGWFGGGGGGAQAFDDYFPIGGGGGSSYYGDRVSSPNIGLATDEENPYVRLSFPDDAYPLVSLDPIPSGRSGTRPTFSGTASTERFDEDHVTVFIHTPRFDSPFATTLVAHIDQATGKWSVKPDQPLPDDVYDIHVEQADGAGNIYADRTSGLVVDGTAPALSIDSPADEATLVDHTVAIRGRLGTATGDEQAVDATVYRGLGTSGRVVAERHGPVSGDAWDLTADLPDGAYTVKAAQRDDVGNVRSLRTSFIVDGPRAEEPKQVDGPAAPVPTVTGTQHDATPAARAVPLQLLSRSLTATHSGRVALNLRNPNAVDASGSVTLAYGRTRLGRAAFKSPAGATTVRLRLSGAGRKALARKRVLRVKVAVRTDAGTTTRMLVLRQKFA